MVQQTLQNLHIPGSWRWKTRDNAIEAKAIGEQIVVASLLYAIQENLKQDGHEVRWQQYNGGTKTFDATEDKYDCRRTFDIICVLGYKTLAYAEYIETVTAFIKCHMVNDKDSIKACLFRRNRISSEYVYMVQTLEYVIIEIAKGNPAFIKETI
jgi:hypothetical protein